MDYITPTTVLATAMSPSQPKFDTPPRFLFRLHSHRSKSRHLGNPHRVSSYNSGRPAAERTRANARTIANDGGMFSWPREEAARMLANHLSWDRHEIGSDFVSWSASLLYTLQLALFRRWSWRDHTELSSMFVCIVDTSQFPEGTFSSELTLLQWFKDADDDVLRLHDLRFKERTLGGDIKVLGQYGEFLSQGNLNLGGNCSVVGLTVLLNAAKTFEKLCPVFHLHLVQCENQDGVPQQVSLPLQISECQRAIATRKPTPSTDSELQTVVQVSKLWPSSNPRGNTWRFPIVMACLALRPRVGNQELVQFILRMGTLDEIQDAALRSARNAERPELWNASELQYQRQLLWLADGYIQSIQIGRLLKEVKFSDTYMTLDKLNGRYGGYGGDVDIRAIEPPTTESATAVETAIDSLVSLGWRAKTYGMAHVAQDDTT